MEVLAVLTTAFIVFFRNVNVYPLRNWDEAWYAQIIKNMASGQHQLLMPFWNGRYYFDHSPLYFWLTFPIIKIFDLGDWQVRLISTTSAVVATFLVFKIGEELKDKKFGLISVFVFLTLGQVITRFGQGDLDSLLTCLFLATFLAYLKSEKLKIYSFLCGLILGLGILVKSWGIGLFPLALIFIYSIFKNKSLPKNLTLVLTAAMLTFSPWYIWGIITFGKTFISWYILNPSESRLNSPLTNFSPFYFKVFFRDVGFYFIPLLITFILSLRKFTLKINPYIASFTALSTIYIISLNFLSDKSDWYAIVAYPLVAFIIAYSIYYLLSKSSKLAAVSILIIAIVQVVNIQRIENIYPDRSKVGADLGLHAKQIIPQNSTVILDDHDFTSFLFYSNLNQVYTIEDNQKSQSSEWWKINHKNLKAFINTHQEVWILTPNPHNLGLVETKYQQKDYFNSYYFLKF